MNKKDLLLQTAFACMACDGEIAKEEVELLDKFTSENDAFKGLDIKTEVASMVSDLNKMGKTFLRNYLSSLDCMELSEEEQLSVLKIAVSTIFADQIIAYSEIKFFKAIRSHFSIDDEKILASIADIDDMWLAQDFVSTTEIIENDYFNNIELKEFTIPNI